MVEQPFTEPERTRQASRREPRPDPAQSFQGRPHPILQLQRTLGNQRVAQLIQAKRLTSQGKIIGLQPKLTVGAADDQYEQEADRVARQVVSMPDSVTLASVQQPRQLEGEANQAHFVQSKPLALAASITPFVQQKMEQGAEKEEGNDREEDKDELLQAKFFNESAAPPLQRQTTSNEEETEPIQAKSDESLNSSFEVGDDVESRLSRSKGGGNPLPDPVRSYMEPRFGADFSHVRVHTGSDAIQMNRDIGAQAFAHGSDVYYGAGSSPSNLELTAHELTHVVQQTGGKTKQISAQVESIASPIFQSRINATKPFYQNLNIINRDTRHVGGSQSSITFLTDERGQVVGPGEAGFSHRMLDQTSEAAEGLMQQGLYEEARLRHVVPSLGYLEGQILARTRTHQRYVGLVRGDDAIFAPWGIAKEMYERGRDWCQQHIDQMNRHKEAENEKSAQYNAWVPVANGFFSSLTRLEAMQNMLGVNNPQAMASALESGLRDAGNVAARAADAFAKGNQTGRLTVPPSDDTVTQALNETNQAAQEMNTAYLGFRQNVLDLEIQSIHEEGSADRERMEQINQVKQFVRNVGRTIDVTASVVSGAPAAITNATRIVRHGEAMLGAHRNRQQILAGQRPTHNPTYLATNEQGEMVVRNVQTGMDRPAAGGEATASPAGPSISLPSSVSDVLGQITDFAYSSEVRGINARLEQIKTRCDSVQGVQNLLRTRERAQNYQDKLNAFALKANALQQRIAQRRQAYLQFGLDLDNFAREDQESRRAGQAPARGEERFATIMTVVSQVREVLSVGGRARAGIFSLEEFRNWAQSIEAERSATPPRTDIPRFATGREEWSRLSSIYNQIRTFRQNVEVLEDIFSGTEGQASVLMRQAHRGGGSGTY